MGQAEERSRVDITRIHSQEIAFGCRTVAMHGVVFEYKEAARSKILPPSFFIFFFTDLHNSGIMGRKEGV